MKINKKILLSVFVFAVLIQLLLITYNQYTGYIQVPDLSNFLTRWITGIVFSTIFGLGLLYFDLIFINLLDNKVTWEKNIPLRLATEFFLTVVVGAIFGLGITLFANFIFPYREPLNEVIITNILICTVINIFLVSIVESILLYKKHLEAKFKAEKLEKENSEIRFEILKNQLNPHFLFNSLNVLSALISSDQNKAQNFIEEFSSLYRYILEVIDKPAVTLKEEISFAKSYLFLQEIRFQDMIIYQINIDAEKLECLVPPLSIQTLLENAIKHNIVSSEHPLKIKIYNNDDKLYISNNLNQKHSSVKSTGIGIKNLIKRYSLISDNSPEFNISESEYLAKLPLIKAQ